MKHKDIAAKNNVGRSYVSTVLAGKSHTLSGKAVQIIIDAANAHAEIQKAKFIANVIYRWNHDRNKKRLARNLKRTINNKIQSRNIRDGSMSRKGSTFRYKIVS